MACASCGASPSGLPTHPHTSTPTAPTAAERPVAGAILAPGWSNLVDVGGFARSETVSCASPGFCVAVSFPDPQLAGLAVTFDGRTWSSARTLAPGTFSDISCPDTGVCEASTGTGEVLSLAHDHWSRPDDVDDLGDIGSVSCTSVMYCVAADDNGDDLVYDGRRWSPPEKGPVSDPYVVSCASPSFCLAVGDDEFSYTIDHGRWSERGVPDGIALPTGLACPVPGSCTMVGAFGTVTTYDGEWSKPRLIDADSELTSLACPSTRFCMAGDYQGRVLTYGDGTWSRPVPVLTGDRAITSLSCPTTTFCVVVSSTEAAEWHAPR